MSRKRVAQIILKMKKTISKNEAEEKIAEFFTRKSFTAGEMKKIKRLAMKYRVPLREYKKEFCQKCFSKLKGERKVSKKFVIVKCGSCGYLNRISVAEKTR